MLKEAKLLRRNLLQTAGSAGIALISGTGHAQAKTIGIVEFEKKTIYHSPQTPGYTSWVGCWGMPGGKLMVSFHQATGPFENRPRTREDVLHLLNWPPKGKPEWVKYDMAG